MMTTKRSTPSILSAPGARALLGSSILARLPLAMFSIALLVNAQRPTGSFAVAGRRQRRICDRRRGSRRPRSGGSSTVSARRRCCLHRGRHGRGAGIDGPAATGLPRRPSGRARRNQLALRRRRSRRASGPCCRHRQRRGGAAGAVRARVDRARADIRVRSAARAGARSVLVDRRGAGGQWDS